MLTIFRAYAAVLLLVVPGHMVKAQAQAQTLSALPPAAVAGPSQISAESRVEAARQYLMQYEQEGDAANLERAIEELRAAVRLKPDLFQAHALLYLAFIGKALKELEQTALDDARKAYDAAYALAPTVVRTELPNPALITAKVYGQQGNLSWQRSQAAENPTEKKKERDEAVRRLQASLAAHPNSRSHILLAEIFAYEGNHELADFEVKQASDLNSSPELPYIYIGYIYIDLINTDQECGNERSIGNSVKAFQQAVRLAPESAEAHTGLRIAYDYKGMNDLAAFHAREAVRLSPTSDRLVHLAITLESIGSYDEAIVHLEEAIKLDTSNNWALETLLHVYFLTQKYDMMEEIYSLLHTRRSQIPTSAFFYTSLDYILSLEANGRAKEAIKVLKNLPRTDELSAWEMKLLHFFLGKLTEAALFEAARTKCEKTEGYFYAGVRQYYKKNLDRAAEYLRNVIMIELFSFREYDAARVFAERIK